MPISSLLLDIEGTLCPISFVKDTLFPYFLHKVPSVLQNLSYPIDESESEVSAIVSKFDAQYTKDYSTLIDHITRLVDRDVKDPVLKSLQGLIWHQGYANGELKAPLYKDAITLIKSFSQKNRVYIYSSGSVKAQKLLFAYVEEAGDLNPYISGYFDITTSGFKFESSSYRKILEDIGAGNQPDSVLFLSDNVKEVEAAIEAGMKSMIVMRPGNAQLSQQEVEKFATVNNFDHLELY